MKAVYKKEVLDNGLRVVVHPMDGMRSVALGIWIRVGGRYESRKLKGAAHFLEHLVFKGTQSYSCRQIKESIEGVGGSLNGFTSEELTCYLVKIPKQHLDTALDILSDMVINPLLPQKDIEKERTVIMEEIKMYKDLPQAYVYDLLDELLWPDQPLGLPIIGTLDSVGSIERDPISSFRKRYYTAPNIIISAAGPINYGRFLKGIDSRFRGQREQGINMFPGAWEKQEGPKLKLLNKKTEQAHMALGFHGFRRDHPLRYALGLLHVVLGGNMSSRLFNEVREKKGLAYEIGTLVKYFQDTGAFIVHAGMDNRKVSDAIGLILKEFKRISTALVDIAEFRRAKDFYLGQLMLALEDTLDHMLWIGESTACVDRVYSLKDVVRDVKMLTRKDLRAVAAQVFRESRMNLALISPLKDTEKEEITRKLVMR